MKDVKQADYVVRTRNKLTAVRKALSIVTSKELRSYLKDEEHKLEMILALYEVRAESARIMTKAIHAECRTVEIRG